MTDPVTLRVHTLFPPAFESGEKARFRFGLLPHVTGFFDPTVAVESGIKGEAVAVMTFFKN
tara:strand:+ start:1517 stop:1699 length:183 start_codon:yes stop_codon:yes gene_type:complete